MLLTFAPKRLIGAKPFVDGPFCEARNVINRATKKRAL
jgi:hypothetical protein